MIILVRHAQSEGNKNRDIHQTIPDHRVKLTNEGHRQAQEAGRKLRDLLRPDDKLHFFTSPYRRTRETTEGILESLTSDTPSPSPFPRDTIKVYEEPRLREQDFGNFQPCSSEMERMWLERADYGHFFYRIPNGESAADAYDRVSGFNESLWRQFGEDDFADVCVLVTHGLMARVFLMKWYHWSVEYFEDLRNINHCEFVILKHNPENGKYILENKLRTWSDLRKDEERENVSTASPGQAEHSSIRRKWGGCPDGCTHGPMTADKKYASRAFPLHSIRHGPGYEPIQYKHNDEHNHSTGSKLQKSTSIDEVVPFSEDSAAHNDASPMHSKSPSDIQPKIPRARDRSPLHSIDGGYPSSSHHHPSGSSSSMHLRNALLRLGGRDGGGSMSGMNSLAPSDDEDDDHYHRNTVPTISRRENGNLSHVNQQHFKFPSPKSQFPPPSQELEDDGDDEMSSNSFGNLKEHHPHHHDTQDDTHLSPTSHSEHRRANILGDGDQASSPSNPPSPKHEDSTGSNVQEPSLEEQQKHDRSIQGSVY